MIYVVNKLNHKPTPDDFYIGRPSSLGNPFLLTEYSREDSIKMYETYFKNKLLVSQHVQQILGMLKRHIENNDLCLVCFCAPLACHGDVIKKYLEGKLL